VVEEEPEPAPEIQIVPAPVTGVDLNPAGAMGDQLMVLSAKPVAWPRTHAFEPDWAATFVTEMRRLG
jgi:hypothetical protein